MKILAIFLTLTFNYSLLFSQGIIFTKQINNNDNLYFIDNEGQTKRITNHNRKDSNPMVSPDGQSIVFTSERVGWWKIWKLDLNTMKYYQLTNSSSAEYSPNWSPDGLYIVFVSSRDGNQELYTMDADGANLKNITNSKNEETFPFWSKDGYIYFSSKINNTYQIARCKPNGSLKETLTTNAGNKLMPQLSNNFKEILYYGDESGNNEIYLMNVSDKKSKKITNHHLMDMRPRWSLDGCQIVFERGNKGNNHHVFMMDKNGNNLTQLTFSNYNYTPSFVPSTNMLFID